MDNLLDGAENKISIECELGTERCLLTDEVQSASIKSAEPNIHLQLLAIVNRC